MSSVNVGALIGTAAGLGVVHVLTGPDHLSAITTLSANVRARQAFGLGIRWGVGHSVGLLLVGIVLIAVTAPVKSAEENQQSGGEENEEVVVPHTLETVFESLVGVFMLLLGSYGIHRAVSRRRARAKAKEEERQQEEEGGYLEDEEDEEARGAGSMPSAGDAKIAPVAAEGVPPASAQVLLSGSLGRAESPPAGADGAASLGGEGSSLLMNPDSESHGGDADAYAPAVFGTEIKAAADTSMTVVDVTSRPVGGEEVLADAASADDETTLPTTGRGRCQCLSKVSERLSTGMAALLIGTVHGLAGPGGVLGVIPAVQLRDWRLAILYLGTFCVVSTLTMGTFATVFGTISSKLVDRSAARLEFCIEFFPSCLSIAVGIVWLVLSPMGMLEAIFG